MDTIPTGSTVTKTTFSRVDLDNLRAIVGTHPTPEGIMSPAAQEKVKLIQKIEAIIREMFSI